MPAPRKYSNEVRERAVLMVLDALEDNEEPQRGVIRRVGEQLGINPDTLRGWVRQTQIDAGTRPGTTTGDTEKLKELGKKAASCVARRRS